MGKTRIRPLSEGVVEFINLKLSGGQFNINANDQVAFVEESSSGLSVVSNRVTLKAGVTYVLSATMRHDGSVSNTAANYQWRDQTNSVNLGVGCQVSSQDATTDDGASPSTTVVIKPTTDIDVAVICTGVSAANQHLNPDATQASIYSL